MAMNIQRKTSNIANIVVTDASGNVTLPAGITVTGLNTAGYVRTNASGVFSISTTVAGSDVTGAALTKTDDTNVTLTLGGTPATSLLRAASLTLGWTGQLAVSRGGTGAATLTGVLIGNGTNAITGVTGTAGQLLRRNAGDTAYEFFTPTYLTANQSITWTAAGDISGNASGTTSITPTLTVTGLRGVALPTLGVSAGFLRYTGTGTNTWVFDTNSYYLASNPSGYTANTGTVTSVALSLPAIFTVSGSPVTTSGTLTATLASQTANQFFAAPNGTAGAPVFRAIVAADIPTLNQNTTGSAGSVSNSFIVRADSGTTEGTDIYTFNGSAGKNINIVAGTNISITKAAGQWTINTSATTNTGTVTSVALSLPGIFTVSGSPVTTSGTLTATLASQTANTFFAAPNGSAGSPTFRAIVAADIPTLNQNTTGSAGSVANAITFNTTGGAAAGTTYNGSAARTIDFSTVGAAAASHTHPWSQITSTPTTISGYGITDAYTKSEVDSFLQGLDPKASVKVATTANITLSGTQTIDGIAVVASDRVLVKDQSTATQNGIYVVSAGAWTRAVDMDVAAEFPGAYVFVEQGTANADKAYVCTNDSVTVGSTNITFVQFAGSGAYQAVLNGTGFVRMSGTSVSYISGTASQFVKADGTLDSSVYLTGNQSITISGDASGSGTTAISLTLATVNSNIGTFNNVTVNAKGLVTAASNVSYLTGNQSITWTAGGDISGNGSGTTSITPTLTVTGLRGVALPTLGASAGFLRYTGTGTNTWVFDTNSYYLASNPSGYTSNTGTVTSVSGTGTVSGLSLSGTVTTSGNITLSGTLSVTPSNFASQTANTFLAAPNGTAGVPTFRTIVAADIPTLNQNTTGSAGSVANSFIIRADSGTTEGTDIYTFNGSAGKNLNIVAGSNITITKAAGSWTIASTATGGTSLNGTGYVKMSGTTPSYVASIPNADLANSSITVQGTAVSLGGSVNVINGTGFVKATGTTISYDNNTYALSSHTHSYFIGTTAVQTSSANQALTGISGITFVAEASDAASISTTISSTSTFFDFNLADDNNNDEWRWRFTPSGGTVYNAMRLVAVSNTASNLIVSGTITGSQIIRSGGTASQFLKADGSVDSNTYITGNQSISISGDATGSGTTAIALTLATVNSNIGTFNNVTVNAKGLVTAASNVSYLTGNQSISLTGEATGSGATSIAVTLTNSAVIGKVLTGLNITGGTVAAADTILTAFGKLQNQINGLTGGVTYQGTWNASTNTPTLASSTGTKGFYYVVSVAGSTALNGVSSWSIGDWVIYNGTAWEKVDNTDAVVSVNGFTGAVSLSTANISESGNLYYTDARARAAVSFTAGSGAYNSSTGVFTIPTNTNQLTNGAGFITGNQSITVSGDASGSGTTAITLTLATVNSNIGTFNNVTVNAKGLVTAASNVSYLTGNQTITLTGNVTGSGTTSIATTIANGVVTNAMLVNSSFHVGTTSISLGRASGAQTLSGVSIDGNAATANRLTSVGVTNLNTEWTAGRLEYFDVQGGTGAPSTAWHSYISVRHGNSSNSNGFQLAYQFGTESLFFRGWDSTNPLTWRTMWHSGNLTNLNQLANGPGYTSNTGTVTSVGGTGTVSGLTLTGTVTTSGNLTLGGTLALTAANVNAVGAITNNTSGTAGSTPVLTASGALTTQQGNGTVIYSYALVNPQTGLFPATDNANSILTLNRHPDNYYSQLGFSSNGNLYYRNFVNTAINTSQAWQTIWTSSSLTNLNQLTNGPGYITSSALGSYLPLAGGTLTGGLSGTTGTFTGGLTQNSGKPVRDSYFVTTSGYSDYYSSGSAGWYKVAEITLTGNCSGAVVYGTLYDYRYDGADTYQIAVVARAECDFTSNNQSHYVNVGCTILGSTATTDYQNKIRVLLTASSSGSRTYELQFYETNWNRDTWQLEGGWTIYSTPQAPGSATGTPVVNYISTQNANFLRANNAVYSPIYYDSSDTAYYLNGNTSSAWRIGTPSGTLDIGPMNAGFCHFQTDRDKFYFNKRVEVDGELWRYAGSRFVENTGTWGINITGNANNITQYTVNQNVGTGDTVRFNQARFTSRISIGDGNGTPYLNTGSPGVWLSYNGGADIFMGAETASQWGVYIGAWRMSLNSSGTLTVGGDVVAYGSPSDARLKTIKEVIQNPIDKIKALSGYRFDWKKTDSILDIKEDIGVIAQEVAEVLPELARTNENGYMSVRYQGLTAVLIEAIKEQQAQIEDLKRQIEFLAENK